MKCGNAERLLRLGESLCNLLEMWQISEFFPSFGGGQIDIQAVEIRLPDFVANGSDFLLGEHLPLALHPVFHLRGGLPIAVVFVQHHTQQMAGRSLETLVGSHFVQIAPGVFCGKNKDFFIGGRPFGRLRDLRALKGIFQDIENQRNQFKMLGRFGNDLIGKFHQGDDDLEAQFCRHFGLQQAVHHLQRDVERVGGNVVAGVEPEVVHEHLAQLFSHKSVVRERVMVFGDALLGAFVDAEILG